METWIRFPYLITGTLTRTKCWVDLIINQNEYAINDFTRYDPGSEMGIGGINQEFRFWVTGSWKQNKQMLRLFGDSKVCPVNEMRFCRPSLNQCFSNSVTCKWQVVDSWSPVWEILLLDVQREFYHGILASASM